MNQIKYLLYACLILFGIAITTAVIKTAFFLNNSDKPLPTQSATIDTEPVSPQGRQLFQQNCQSCHKIQGASPTAPALAGVLERGPWSDPAKLHAWVKNPAGFKDPYTDALKKQYGYIMTGFPNLTNEQIDAIIDFCSLPPMAPSVIACR